MLGARNKTGARVKEVYSGGEAGLCTWNKSIPVGQKGYANRKRGTVITGTPEADLAGWSEGPHQGADVGADDRMKKGRRPPEKQVNSTVFPSLTTSRVGL